MKTRPKIRILLADDHLVVRMGLALMISRQPDMELAGEAENGKEAVRLAQELRPEVIIMDLQMPVMDGATATQTIRTGNPDAKILILTTFGGCSMPSAQRHAANTWLTTTSACLRKPTIRRQS